MKPLVVVIFGASGSGKSTLLELLEASGGQYSIHIKATDRPPRQYDDVEIRCVKTVTADMYDYIYQTYGHRYGIEKKQIDAALTSGRHHFIICNDIDVIKSLKRDYGSAVRVVFHSFDAPREALRQIQESRGIDDDEIGLRLAKTTALYRAYVENHEIFDAVLQNRFGQDLASLKKRMETILLDFAKKDDTGILIKRIDEFTAGFQKRLEKIADSQGDTVDPGYVFIIMAMPENDPGSEDVHQTIKRSCTEVHMRAERVDEIQYTGKITTKIQSSIRLAQVVVADLTQERPNVYYEIGYADALHKPLVLVAKRGSKIHFDLHGDKVLFYRNMVELGEHLQRVLKALCRPPQPNN